jgi:hypothetical protein
MKQKIIIFTSLQLAVVEQIRQKPITEHHHEVVLAEPVRPGATNWPIKDACRAAITAQDRRTPHTNGGS